MTQALRDIYRRHEHLRRIVLDLESRLLGDHADSHEDGGSDEIDGGNLSVDYDPTNYTETAETVEGHYTGIDNEFGELGQDIFDNEALLLSIDVKLAAILKHLELINGVQFQPEEGGLLAFLDQIIEHLCLIKPLE
jgi:hypothetical protein